MKTLSVVLPNYNHSQYLKYSIPAICEQKRIPDQLIIIDDASTDNSMELLKEYQKKYKNIISLHRNEKNIGVVNTLNTGLSHVRCDYVYFASADDIIFPELFSESMKMLERYPDANLCSSLSMMMGVNNEKLGYIKSPLISFTKRYFEPEKIKKKYIWNGSWLMGNTTIYKTDPVLEMHGFDIDLKSYTDNFLSTMLAFKGGVCFIPEVQAAWRRGNSSYADNISNDLDTMKSIYSCAKYIIDSDYKDVCSGAVYQAWNARMKHGLVACEIKNNNKTDMCTLLFNNDKKSVIERIIIRFVSNKNSPVFIKKLLAGLLLIPKHMVTMAINIMKWQVFLLFNKDKLRKLLKTPI